MMNAMILADLADKARRDLRGRREKKRARKCLSIDLFDGLAGIFNMATEKKELTGEYNTRKAPAITHK